MALIDGRRALTRERRTGALSAYHGSLEALKSLVGGEIKQTVRTFSQCAPDEIIAALRILGEIKGAAIVVHGGAGCAASALALPRDEQIRWYSTNLDEKDSILGGDERLRDAIGRVTAEFSPSAVFVVGTPVIAINNDDVNSVILEMGDGVAKIVFVGVDGFKSKNAVTGYDIVSHVLLKELVEPSGEKEDFADVISISESAEDVLECLRILRFLGIEYNAFPKYSSVERIRSAARARVAIALNGSEGEYLAKGLQESFGVKFIPTDVPIGLSATRSFTRAIAAEFGLESAAKQYIASEENDISGLTAEAPLDGVSFFLNMDLAAAAGFSEMVRELGGRIAGIAAPFIDENNRDLLERFADPEITVVIADGQPFEISNALSKINPDCYVGGAGVTAFASCFGAFPVSTARRVFYGYGGFRDFARLARKIAAAKAEPRLSSGSAYRTQWLAKSGNWYVKTEVK